MINTLRKLGPATGLLLFVAFVFLLGGSQRAETASIALLRPGAAIALGMGMVLLLPETWRDNRALLACAFGWVCLTVLHLVPLPPAIWQSLPGRELAQTIDQAAGLDIWRPISLVPWRTMNALLAQVVPLAALLLALRVPADRSLPVVLCLLGLVVVSATMGLLQVIGGSGTPFYTYAVTNNDSAVGLFANRNHNALFLAMGFPLIAATLAMWVGAAETQRTREMAGIGAGLMLIPFLLTTQSRAGLVVGLVGIALAWWIYRSPSAVMQKRRPHKQIDPRLVLAALGGLALVMLTMVFSATNAIHRLGEFGGKDDELRMQVWPPITNLVGDFFPFGSGIGTFVEVYGAAEPESILQPSYLNHAHNDLLELALTGGLPFLLLLAIGAFVCVRRGFAALGSRSSMQRQVIARLGISICLILALGSIYDYPLRTPSLAALFAVGIAFWAGFSGKGQQS